jgi:type IV pilus assembly protein PilN
MMDLETVLPSGVQVTSIEPSVTADGDVVIRMRVAGDRDRAVQLVRNLEHSKRFLQPRLSSEAVQAKDLAQANAPANGAVGNVEFEILANYNPLPEGEAYPKEKAVVEETSTPMEGMSHAAKGGAAAHAPMTRPGVTLKPMPPMQRRGPVPKPNPQMPVAPSKPGQNGKAA